MPPLWDIELLRGCRSGSKDSVFCTQLLLGIILLRRNCVISPKESFPVIIGDCTLDEVYMSNLLTDLSHYIV